MRVFQNATLPAVLLVGAILCAGPAPCQEGVCQADHSRNKSDAQNMFEAKKKTFGANPDMRVKPGILANRKEKWIRVDAEASGLRSDYNCEFLMVAEKSGHAYESLLVSFAAPSDIHDALVFCGLKPGRPVDGNRFCLWPRGERAIVNVEWENGKRYSARGESLLVNRDLGGPLPKDGFVFAGSVMRTPPGNPTGEKVYAADSFEPCSIVSFYNDAETVMDVPRMAGQGKVYAVQFPNPEYPFRTGQLVRVTFEPEHKDGRTRVADLTLRVGPRESGKPVAGLPDVAASLIGPAGTNLMAGARLQDTLPVFQGLAEQGRDAFVRVEFDGDLPLPVVHDIAVFLEAVDTEKGIRVEPPPAGHPFYRAFIPTESLRDRASRGIQPWELRLTEKDGKLGGTMTLIEDKLNKDTYEWSTETRHFDAATPDAIRTTLNMKQPETELLVGPQFLFIFAPKKTLYKELLPFVSASLETRPYIHVYLE